MESQIYITSLREEHLDRATDVVTRSFLNLNEIWKNSQTQYTEIFPVVRGKILPAIHYPYSYVLMKGHQVVGVSVEYELFDYLQNPSMPSQLELFKKLGQAGQKLQAKTDFSQIKRGEALYGLYGVISPDFAGKGHSLQFWWNLFARGKISGVKYYYSRISSPVSLKMLKKLGAEVLSQVEVQKGEKLWMIRIDLEKPFPSFSMLKSFTQKNNKQRPSL